MGLTSIILPSTAVDIIIWTSQADLLFQPGEVNEHTQNRYRVTCLSSAEYLRYL